MVKTCPNCKTSNMDNAEFCQNCGQKLGTTTSGTSTQSQTGGISGWWNQRGTGAKAAIGIAGICCIGLILIVAFAGMFSSDKTTTTTPVTNTPTSTTPTTNTSNSNSGANYIEVSYPTGSWDGSITVRSSSNNEQEFNFDGSGTKKFDLTPYKDEDIWINAQKEDGSSGKLSVVIVKNGVKKFDKSTTEGYGIVSGWLFSYE